MANRKKRAFFRRKTNPSKLYGNDRFRMNEARKQQAGYVKASTPSRFQAASIFAWGR
jgi:hypothetical protein